MRKKPKKEILKDKNRVSITMKCKYCGHTNTIPAFIDNKICSWCHKRISNQTQAYFTKKILETMKEMKNDE